MKDIDPYAPCLQPPGSEGKMLVLTERARLELPLFLSGDAVDNRRRRRGGEKGVRRRLKRPELWAQRFEVAAALDGGETYRSVAARLACCVRQVQLLAERARMEARLTAG